MAISILSHIKNNAEIARSTATDYVGYYMSIGNLALTSLRSRVPAGNQHFYELDMMKYIRELEVAKAPKGHCITVTPSREAQDLLVYEEEENGILRMTTVGPYNRRRDNSYRSLDFRFNDKDIPTFMAHTLEADPEEDTIWFFSRDRMSRIRFDPRVIDVSVVPQ